MLGRQRFGALWPPIRCSLFFPRSSRRASSILFPRPLLLLPPLHLRKPHKKTETIFAHKKKTKRKKTKVIPVASVNVSGLFTPSAPSSGPDDVALDAATGFALGFPPSALADDEVSSGALPPGASVAAYARARNRVLGLWRRDVRRALPLASALEGTTQRGAPLVAAAWRFLDAHGFINFGIDGAVRGASAAAGAAAMKADGGGGDGGDGDENQNSKRHAPNDLSDASLDAPAGATFPGGDRPPEGGWRGSVLVVGAGVAGLTAARQLRRSGHRVLVLEGHSRPGGRVHAAVLDGGDASRPFSSDGKTALRGAADLGGSILTGIDGNPLAALARQLGAPLHRIVSGADHVPLMLPDGRVAPREADGEVEAAYNSLLDACDGLRATLPADRAAELTLGGALEQLWREDRERVRAERDSMREEEAEEAEEGEAEKEKERQGGEERDEEEMAEAEAEAAAALMMGADDEEGGGGGGGKEEKEKEKE